jgi:hypothetical protein
VRQSAFSVRFIPSKTQSFQGFPPFFPGITGLSGFGSYAGKITFLERTAERTERTTSKRQYAGRFEHRQIIFEVYCYEQYQLGQTPRRADHGAVLQALPRQQKDRPVSPAQRQNPLQVYRQADTFLYYPKGRRNRFSERPGEGFENYMENQTKDGTKFYTETENCQSFHGDFVSRCNLSGAEIRHEDRPRDAERGHEGGQAEEK